MRSLAALALALLLSSCQAFVPQSSCRGITRAFASQSALDRPIQSSTLLFSSSDPESETETASDSTPSEPAAVVTDTSSGGGFDPTPVKIEEESGAPLDVPSPLLLASSIILAIVSTGSIFDLLAGNPTYGFAPTAGVALIGFPLCIFLFGSAIVKGQKETEEDDKKFGGGGF